MKEIRLKEIRDQCIALQKAMDASRKSKVDDVWLHSSFKTFMRKYNEILAKAQEVINIRAPVDMYNLENVPSAFDTVTIEQRIYFDEVYTNLLILKAFVETTGGLDEVEADNILNFLKANLRKAIYETPQNEKTIQNGIESLLIGKGKQKGIDYDRETGRVKVAGKESIPDFVFKNQSMVLEVKICNRSGKLAEIIDEMNADIVAYSSGYEFIYFLIYDLGYIRDEDEIIKGLEISDNIKCFIVKH
ncbi:hypothetical protein [Acinetobacter nosocomialis]|uniref:PD-(D/E)XK nuclease domain-containing protein n=1 Tax=Acinetobacter nosocomialis TaxID=106654 RepID=UPI001B8378C7|nr:hypothetical protein [Acinetobacter nosocomialis]